jgi:hypothetical protein
MNLLELLRAPGRGRAAFAQRSAWPSSASFGSRCWAIAWSICWRSAAEILHEEELAIWMQFNPPAAKAREASPTRPGERADSSGPVDWSAHAEVPVFGDQAHEYEKFSADTAWMPTVGADRQKHLRVAGADEPAVWPHDCPPR